MFENVDSTINIIDGIFLLFLAISGNFLAETMGCQMQKLLTNNMIAKQIAMFLLIFFTMDFSDSTLESPSVKFKKTVFVYILFLLLSKMDLKMTIFAIILLAILYISHIYKKYYEAIISENNPNNIKKSEKEEYAKSITTISNLQKILMTLTGGVILVGFFIYLIEKKQEHKKSFNLIKFIFGVKKCKHM